MTSNAQKPERPDPGFWTTFKDTGGTAMAKHWRDRFELEDFGAWTFMVKDGNAGSSWTTDPVLLKGFWYLSSSYYVPVLWFHGGWRHKGRDFVPGPAGDQSFLRMLRLRDLQFWSVVS